LIGYDDLPGPRKVAASAPQLDGIDLERWHELLGIWRAIGIHDRVTLLNFARELARGGESARTIGLGEALAEVDRVIAANQGKHPRSKWRTYSVTHHLAKAIGHAAKFIGGERLDPESRRHAMAHTVARGLMALALELENERH
jgi:hypothetical protein